MRPGPVKRLTTSVPRCAEEPGGEALRSASPSAPSGPCRASRPARRRSSRPAPASSRTRCRSRAARGCPSPAAAVELVDEEAGAAEQHVGDALHALEGVVDVVGGGEELVLAHVELAGPAFRWIGTMWPAPSRLKAIMPGPAGLGDEDLHARHHPLERPLHRLDADPAPRGASRAGCGARSRPARVRHSTVSTGTSSPSI